MQTVPIVKIQNTRFTYFTIIYFGQIYNALVFNSNTQNYKYIIKNSNVNVVRYIHCDIKMNQDKAGMSELVLRL